MSRWFAKGSEYARLIHEDLRMRKAIKEKYYHAGIAEVDIERVARRSGSSSTRLGRGSSSAAAARKSRA